jgi:hypothetical protein
MDYSKAKETTLKSELQGQQFAHMAPPWFSLISLRKFDELYRSDPRDNLL